VKVEILPEARDDLLDGFLFYERQSRGLGTYFRDSLLEDSRLARSVRLHSRQSFGISSQFEQAISFRGLLSRRGGCSSCARDS